MGADSPRYQLVDADYGKLIKVRLSFTDLDGFSETVTSDPFPAVRRVGRCAADLRDAGEQHGPDEHRPTRASPSSTPMGFTLGGHGQGYELSTISIELAAVPTDLTVSLWIADHADNDSTLESRLYDFENPATFAVGANDVHGAAGRTPAPEYPVRHRTVRFHVHAVDQGDDIRRRGHRRRDRRRAQETPREM